MNQTNLVQTLSPKKRKIRLVLSNLRKIDNKVKGVGRKYSETSSWIWNNKQIKNLDTNHIRSILKGLKPNNLKFNGHSKTEWIEAFKLEMQHRNQLADSFLANIFPEFNKKHKEAVKQVLQQQNNG